MKSWAIAIAVLFAASLGAQGCHRHEATSDEGHDHAGQHEPGEHDHGHGHAHGDDAIGITRFTDKLELYAEHPPAVSGQKLTFLAHLTILDGFSPVDQAAVTLILDGPAHAEARVTEKLRPGIFQPTLTAPAPGTYAGRLVISGPEVKDTIGGFDIVVYPDARAAKRAASAEEPKSAGRIAFLKEQQWEIPFATAFAEQGSLVPTLDVAGEVTTPPSGRADVGAAITGRVVAPAKGLPEPGQRVRRGQLLLTIAPAPASPEDGARADLAVVEAEARVESARAAAERADRLIADRAIPQRQVDEAHRELRVAEEALEAARRARAVFSGAASGRGGGIYRVTAPIDGVVVDVRVTEGKPVTSGEPLLRVVDLSTLWIRARVPEQQAAGLQPEEDGAFSMPGLDRWLPLDVTGEDANASVVDVARTVSERSRTVDVIYALKQPDDRLRVGAMVRVGVPVGERWQGVVVPETAVIEDDGRSVVYVQAEGEAFEERTVRLGPRSGAAVGIERGVRAGERVVTRGANVIRLSARAATAPAHGHVH